MCNCSKWKPLKIPEKDNKQMEWGKKKKKIKIKFVIEKQKVNHTKMLMEEEMWKVRMKKKKKNLSSIAQG